MIKLSARMQAIADEILPGRSVADIGTDHAMLPIYLYENGISPKIILTDSKEGPLLKARANLEKFKLLDFISDLRLGSGLSVLQPGEIDTVVIAGMGGLLISGILGEDPGKSRSFSSFVLQPRTAADELRAWLDASGFSIVNEKLAAEGNRISEIFTVSSCESASGKEEFQEEMDFEIPPLLLQLKDPMIGALIDKKIKQSREILENLAKSESAVTREASASLDLRIQRLNERKAQL
jgi:tRNA (adenine22-N1)-methyltransferase